MKRAITLAVALVVLLATPAFAHVEAGPASVAVGSEPVITFRVPDESSDANTTKVEVTFPEAAPFDDVQVEPVAGWTHTETETGGHVTKVTWEGGKIAPGEFQEFAVAVAPVPNVDTLEFKTVQTYDNGDVVRWIDPVVDGQPEPDHPAPTVTVTKAGASGEAGVATDATDKGTDGTSTATFVALAIAGAALIAAVAALIMGTKRPPA